MTKTFHLVGLPHTETTRDHVTCAYTAKVQKLSTLLTRAGARVILYAGERNEAECTEHVTLISRKEQKDWFGKPKMNDLDRGGFNWDAASPWWMALNSRGAAAILSRAEPRDLVLLPTGEPLRQMADILNRTLLCCEPGVGYEGFITHSAFESEAFRHYAYAKAGVSDGRWFDTVIPNFFDPDDFPHLNDGKGDYLLYVGRLVKRKGVQAAAQIADAMGMRLVVAGPGGKWKKGAIVCPELTITGSRLEYVGPVGVKARAKLMAGARAVLVPTQYIEPFGGVAVEAMMCGTPVVTTDFGAFTETVLGGVSGYRFHTLAEACQAVELCGQLQPATIRAYAHSRYSLAAVAPQYARWFARLDHLWGEGWDTQPIRRPAAAAA